MTGADDPGAGGFVGDEHRLPVRIYYEDTDFTGLVYHASYVRFLERGRSDFLRVLGIGHVDLAAREVAFAVVRLELDFRQAARIDDALTVATRLAEVRGARVRFDQAIFRGDRTIATASVAVACIDSTGRPRRTPPDLNAALATKLSNPSAG